MAQNSTTYSPHSKLRVIKAPKYSAGAFDQQNRFNKLQGIPKNVFCALDGELLGNSEI